MIHKVISVYGNSYKTTTAINLTSLLASMYPKAGIAYVSVDNLQPALPLIFPRIDSENSLGKLMSRVDDIDADAILSAGEIARNNIAVYGYNKGENVNSYAKTIGSRIDDLYMYMRSIFDITVIDCTKDVMGSKYTEKAIINSDMTVNLISCDIYGLTFFDSQQPILKHAQYGYDSFINCLTLGGAFEQDTMEMTDITGARHIIPYSKKVVEAINQGLAFDKVPDKNYRKVLYKIIEEITGEKAAESGNEDNYDND